MLDGEHASRTSMLPCDGHLIEILNALNTNFIRERSIFYGRDVAER